MSAPGIINMVPLATMNNAQGNIPNIKLYFASASTTNGVATVYPTSDGTPTGTALFSQVLHADAQAWVNTSLPIAVVDTGGKSIGSDQRSVSFNVTAGNAVVLGGNSVVAAPNGTMVTCVVWGLP